MSSSYLSGIFGGSPVAPLQQHMERVFDCVEQLIPFIEAVLKQEHASYQVYYEAIVTLEREADDLKQELRKNIPDRLLMPVPRADLLDLLRIQDQVAGKAKDIAGIMLGRKMQLPEAIADDFLNYVKRNVDCCKQTSIAINELDELIGTGFVKGEVQRVETMLEKIDDIEYETDQMQIDIRAKLFAIENDLKPIDVMFLYHVIDMTGELADGAEQVGNRLQLMLEQ